MSNRNTILKLALVIFCYISQVFCLKCYTCDSNPCNGTNLQMVTCNQDLAARTSQYLRHYHIGVNYGYSSENFECFKEYLTNSKGQSTYYKGCIYSKIKGCELPLSYSYTSMKQACGQCKKDACNPASHATINVLTVFIVMSFSVILSYFWR